MIATPHSCYFTLSSPAWDSSFSLCPGKNFLFIPEYTQIEKEVVSQFLYPHHPRKSSLAIQVTMSPEHHHWLYIPQLPQDYLSPIHSLENIVSIYEKAHHVRVYSPERKAEILELLELPPHMLQLYPSEISFGMKKRFFFFLLWVLSPRWAFLHHSMEGLPLEFQDRLWDLLLIWQKETQGSLFILQSHHEGKALEHSECIPPHRLES